MRTWHIVLLAAFLTTLMLLSSGCRVHSMRNVSNYCGNEVCEKGENPENCRKDCPLYEVPQPQADNSPVGPEPDNGE